MYENPRCGQIVNGQQCNYPPINRCQRCGRLICIEHTRYFQSPNSGPGYAIFNGIYCPDCEREVNEEHNNKVKNDNLKNDACSCMNCGCSILDSICRSV